MEAGCPELRGRSGAGAWLLAGLWAAQSTRRLTASMWQRKRILFWLRICFGQLIC